MEVGYYIQKKAIAARSINLTGMIESAGIESKVEVKHPPSNFTTIKISFALVQSWKAK